MRTKKPAPEEDGASTAELQRAWRDFFAKEPAEAKRQRREGVKNAKWSRRRRSVEGSFGQNRVEQSIGSPSSRTRPSKHRGQVTGLQRGFATITTDLRFVEYGFGLAHTVAPAARALPWPNDPNDPSFRAKLAAVVAAQRPWHLVQHARFAATLFDGAEAFYREVRSAYRACREIEQDLAAWPPWTTGDEIEAARASLRYEMDGSLEPESQDAADRLKRLARELPPPPERLHRAWNAAKLRESGEWLQCVPRERGTGAAVGREWPRFVRVEILVGGHRRLYLPELAGKPGRIARVDLLSSRLLLVLYGPARRTGPKAAALEFVAEVMDRSPAQVEKLCTSARGADAAK